MRRSSNRLNAARMAVAGALLAGAVVAAGCGGGGSNKSAAPPPPAAAPSAGGGAVAATGTQGLIGPVSRAVGKSVVARDIKAKIPANANHVPKSHGHAVGAIEDCNGDVMPDGSNTADMNAKILCLVNAERQLNGNLPPLTENPQLEQAAQGMGQQMVSEQFFDHVTPEGKNVVDRVQPTGYIPDSGDWVVGENLAWGNGSLSTPLAIVNGWMNSPGHRANILAPDYKDVGLAAVMGSPSPSVSGGTVYVNDFGAKSGGDANFTLPPEGGGGNNTATTSSTAKSKTASARSAKKHHRRRHHKRKH